MILFLFNCTSAFSQLSQGGDPLPSSMLRSATSGFFVDMESFDAQRMIREDSVRSKLKGAARFAKKFYTDISPVNSGVRFTLADGTKVWQCGIRSQGAYSLNLLFTRYYLPKGARLFIYNSDRTSKIGAFTELNNNEHMQLPTAPVYGDEIIVEYQEPADAEFSGLLTIGEVNHDYRGLTLRSRPGALASTATCHRDVACFPAYADVAQATTLLIINGNEYCTGCLVNNAEQDGTPYLLSAAHCFLNEGTTTSARKAQNTVIFFNYQNPSCSSVVVGSEDYSLASANLLLFEQSLDVALLRLAQAPPVYYRPYYAGFNAGYPASPPYFSVHHPMGKTKKIAIERHKLSLTSLVDSGLPYLFEYGIHWRIPSWEEGVTEGGSSGSPLFDSNKNLIGALTGGASDCESPADDYYYSLAKVWSFYSDPLRQLKHWLDPKNRGISQIDGFDPYAATSCRRISNVGANEVPEISYLRSPETGPVFSKNSLQVSEIAERYITKKSTTVYGVHLVIPAWKTTMNGRLSVNLYKGYNQPDSLPLATKTVQLSYLNFTKSSGFYYATKPNSTAIDVFVRFTIPVKVDYSFFVSCKVSSSVDTFRIFNAADRSSFFSSAYVNRGGKGWIASNKLDNPLFTSLWIDPIIHPGADIEQANVDSATNETAFRAAYKPETRSISFVGLDPRQQYRLRIYDSLGKIICQDRYINEQSFIRDLPDGVYIVCITSDLSVAKQKILVY